MPAAELERRLIQSPRLEIRAARDSGPGTIEGYAALFGQAVSIADYFYEQIQPGAFKASIEADDIRCLINHNDNHLMGRNTAGTLRLSEDDQGLVYACDLPDRSDARDLAVSIGRGDMSGCSFGFWVDEDTWDFSGPMPLRTLIRVKLYDVGPVTNPANAQTNVSVRGLEQARADHAATLQAARRHMSAARRLATEARLKRLAAQARLSTR